MKARDAVPGALARVVLPERAMSPVVLGSYPEHGGEQRRVAEGALTVLFAVQDGVVPDGLGPAVLAGTRIGWHFLSELQEAR